MTIIADLIKANGRLPARLQQVAEMVPKCRCLFDIGTDHGYLPIWLVQNNRCQNAVAADLRPEPLERAARHVRDLGLSDRIEACLTNGLAGLFIGAEDVVVIAGLGGNEIMDILGAGSPDCQAIILQPMKSAPELRLWLFDNGYAIIGESLSCDRGRYYPIISCVRTGVPVHLDLLSAWVGPELLRSRPRCFGPWLATLRSRLVKRGRSCKELIGLPAKIDVILGEIAEHREGAESMEAGSRFTVRDVMQVMEILAPAALAEPWDRIGLQLGDPSSQADKVLVALDLTRKTLQLAQDWQASLIICHHPVIFSPIVSIRQDDPLQSLLIDTIRARISVYTAHTNLDAAPGGVADTWADYLMRVLEPCLPDSVPEPGPGSVMKLTPYGRQINLTRKFTLREMIAAIGKSLPGSSCRVNCSLDTNDADDAPLGRIASFPGSFPIENLPVVADAGIEAVICGECKYHDGLLLGLAGIAVISVGHDLSEQPAMKHLAECLSRELPQISFAVNPGMDYNG